MEETGARIDDETDSPLSTSNTESTMWTITGVTEEVQQRDQQIKPPEVSNDKSSNEKAKTDIPRTAKKKKSSKTRKLSACNSFSLRSSWHAKDINFKDSILL